MEKQLILILTNLDIKYLIYKMLISNDISKNLMPRNFADLEEK